MQKFVSLTLLIASVLAEPWKIKIGEYKAQIVNACGPPVPLRVVVVSGDPSSSITIANKDPSVTGFIGSETYAYSVNGESSGYSYQRDMYTMERVTQGTKGPNSVSMSHSTKMCGWSAQQEYIEPPVPPTPTVTPDPSPSPNPPVPTKTPDLIRSDAGALIADLSAFVFAGAGLLF